MMLIEQIMQMPAVIKVLITLSVILLANSLSKKLLPSLVLGVLLLAIWTGQDTAAIAGISWQRSISLNNLMLLLTVSQVMWMSRQMQTTGIMDELVNSVRQKLSRRGAMAALPALIGFLPMPGGALFSAPMVESCDQQNHTCNTHKAIINHWFRHVWECWWPMFPGVLLTMELTGFDVPQMLVLGMPISLASILFGYLLLLKRIPDTAEEPEPGGTGEAGQHPGLLRLMEPIIVVIMTYAAIRLAYGFVSRFFSPLPEPNRYMPMCIGLFLAMLTLNIRRPVGLQEWKKILFSRQVLNMVLIIMAVRIYGAFIEAESQHGHCLITQMRTELGSWGIPVIAVIMILPFVTGLATGMAVGYIGASFPIVLSLIGEDPSFGAMLSMTVLAYGFGYMGFLLSPVHVCLVVSCKHFNASVLRSMAGLVPPAILVMLSSVGLSKLWEIVLS